MSDALTSAGVYDSAVSKKMFTWNIPSERMITIMTSGNPATTPALISLLEECSKTIEDRDPNILREQTMFQVACLVGATLDEMIGATRRIEENDAI